MRIGSIVSCHYKPGQLEYISFIRGGNGWSHHQGPSFYQFSDSRVLMLWTAYDIHECSNDNVILYSVSKNLGETWSDPEVFMASPGANVSHSFLVQLHGSNKVLMFNREGRYVGAKVDPITKRVIVWADYARSLNRIILRESLDQGQSWSFGQEFPPELIVPNYQPPFYGAPEDFQQLTSGRLLLATVYLPPDKKKPQHYSATFLYSDDEGKTWHRSNNIEVPEQRGAMEPTFVELEPNHLYCLLRNKSGYLYKTTSSDGGTNWDIPIKTKIPSPEAICKLLKLKSGDIILIWNNVSSTSQQPRYPLVVALSRDGCRSWSKSRVIAMESGLNQLSNFGVIQLNDGRILLGISHYHATSPTTSDIDIAIFDENWLMK